MFVDLILRVPIPRDLHSRPADRAVSFAVRVVLAGLVLAALASALLLPLVGVDPQTRGQAAGRAVPIPCVSDIEMINSHGGFSGEADHLCVY